jgi:LysM repeat protein
MTEPGSADPATESQICPTCGTKNSENTSRCVVCGTSLKDSSRTFSGRKQRQIILTLPVALLLLIFFSLVSAGLTFGAISLFPSSEEPTTPTVTATQTATQTSTPEPTFTHTPEPTYTPLPPIEYTIATGDSCVGLAFFYDVSVRSIIEMNNLGVDCLLSIGTTILIPQPTPTNTPEPTATLSAAEATDEACEKIPYTVQANDTLSSIAEN